MTNAVQPETTGLSPIADERAADRATAIASSAAVADALATAFYILGTEETQKYCQAHAEVDAVMLPDAKHTNPKR